MMCFFKFYFLFLCLITVWDSKTASIFFNSILFGGKVNLVSAFGWSKFPIVFQTTGKNNIQIKKKREFLPKICNNNINIILSIHTDKSSPLRIVFPPKLVFTSTQSLHIYHLPLTPMQLCYENLSENNLEPKKQGKVALV